MRRRTKYGVSALAGVALAASTAVGAATAATPSSPSTTSVAGSVPSWATSANAVGAVNPHQNLSFQVSLSLRNQAQASALAAAVSDPASKDYRHYLSAAEFNKRFSPTAAQVKRVSAFLRSHGLHVSSDTASNNRFVLASGSVATIQSAFHTQLRNYRTAGQVTRGLAKPLQVPTSLSSDIAGSIGLNDFKIASSLAKQSVPGQHSAARTGQRMVGKPAQKLTPAQLRAAADPRTCNGQATSWSASHDPIKPPTGVKESDAICGYSPSLLNAFYGSSGGAGAGQRIGILDPYKSSAIASDANRYFTSFHFPTLTQNKNLIIEGPGGMAPSDMKDSFYGEQLLDVESAHTIAPAATIDYYGTKSFDDIFVGENALVSANKVNVISNSFGDTLPATPDEIKSVDPIFIQAAAQGIGIYFSTGDDGDNTHSTDPKVQAQPSPFVSYPAQSAWVTAVGGTSVGISMLGHRVVETGWEDQLNAGTGSYAPVAQSSTPGGFAGGGGGGRSALVPEPRWQVGVVPSSLAGGRRVLPDVSAIADPYTGFAIGFTAPQSGGYQVTGYGGTSLASPVTASLVADTQALQHTRFGLITPLLYKNAKNTTVFYDVPGAGMREYLGKDQSGANGAIFNNIQLPADPADGAQKKSTILAGGGWDPVTGVGTPNGAGFFKIK